MAVVSHELRTPLTSVQGYIKTMLQLADDLPDDQRRSFLEAADRQSDRLRRLIEQLLVVATARGPRRAARAQLGLARPARGHVVDELRPRAHGHTFDVRIPDSLHPMHTDEGKLHQILSNLVENALKYAPPDTRVTVERGARGERRGADASRTRGPASPRTRRSGSSSGSTRSTSRPRAASAEPASGSTSAAKMAEAIGGQALARALGREGSAFALFVPSHARRRRTSAPDEGIEEAAQSMTASVWPVSTT